MASTLPVGFNTCSRGVSTSAVAPVLAGQNDIAQNWRMSAAAKTKTGNVLPEGSKSDRQMVAPAAREHPDLDTVSGR